jgi:type IV pilus assembly protein PilX
MEKTFAHTRTASSSARQKQGGVILFIALIALVALTMAGIGFMRSVDAGKLLAGNLAFSRASVAISDAGMEDARALLARLDAPAMANCGQTALDRAFSCLWMNAPQINAATPNSVAPGGYFAWSDPNFNPRNADWANANASTPTCNPVLTPGCVDPQSLARSGYDVRYIVHRMCDLPFDAAVAGQIGRPDLSKCQNAKATGAGEEKAPGDYAKAPPTSEVGKPLYRVTIRVAGPRNTQSFVQVWMS